MTNKIELVPVVYQSEICKSERLDMLKTQLLTTPQAVLFLQ